MILTKTTKTLVAAAGLALVAGTANAATSVTLFNDSATPILINQTGTLISAYDLGDSVNVNGSAPATTAVRQGMTMNTLETTGNHTTSANTVNLTGYTNDVSGLSIITTTSGPHFGSVSGTLAPDQLYGSFIFSNGTDQAINVSGLNSGNSYNIQFGFGDNRTQSFLDFDFSVVIDGVDTGQDITWNTSDAGSGDIYASALVQVSGQTSMNFDLVSNNGIGPGFSYVTVHQVPEPSSAALLGLGGLALLLRRRK